MEEVSEILCRMSLVLEQISTKTDNICVALYSLLSTLSYITSYDLYFFCHPYEVVTVEILPQFNEKQ